MNWAPHIFNTFSLPRLLHVLINYQDGCYREITTVFNRFGYILTPLSISHGCMAYHNLVLYGIAWRAFVVVSKEAFHLEFYIDDVHTTQLIDYKIKIDYIFIPSLILL